MENESIREFTCNDCQEVTKVDWSKVRPDIDDGTSNIGITFDDGKYIYVGECDNCGNLVEIEPPVPELKVTNVEVDKEGMYIEVTDIVTNRSCWIEAWQDKNGDWEYDFNQYIFHLDNDNDIVAKMFQEDLGNYAEEVFDCVMGAIDDHEEEYNKLQENKVPTMRDRLKEAKAGTVSIKAYGKVYYEFSEEEWDSKSEEEKEATIVDTADQATEEEGHTVYEDEVEVITENRKVTEAKDDLEGIKNLIVYEKTQDIFEELYHNKHLDCEYNGSNGVVKITSANEQTFNIIDKVMVDKLHYSKLSNYVYELNEGPIYRDIKGGFDFKGYSYKVDVKFTLNENDTIVGTIGISEIDVKKESKKVEVKGTKLSFEDWKDSDLYIPALLKYYDVDTEEELADCNISENDIVDIYNEYKSNENNQDWYYYEIHFDFTEESGRDSDGYSKFFKSKENVDGDYSEEVWNLAIAEDVIGDEDDFYDVDYTQQIDKDEYERATRTKTESKKVTESINTDVTYLVQQRSALDGKLWWVVVAHSNLTDKETVEGKFKNRKDAEEYKSKMERAYNNYKKTTEGVKTESAPADVIEYFGMQDNTDEEYKNNVAKEYKTLRAKYPDKEMILNGDFGTYLGTEKATPVEKGEYITVYNKVTEAKFKDKVKAIKNNLKKNDKRLSDETAEKSAEKIAGSMLKKEENRYTVYDYANGDTFQDEEEKGLEPSQFTIYDNKKDDFYYDKAGNNPVFDKEEDAEMYIKNNLKEEKNESKETYEYSLDIRDKNTDEFLYQVDCYTNPKEAEEAKKSLKLNQNEKASITTIIYDENGEELETVRYDESKKVTESKTSDMDTVAIIMELEGGELTIEDADDWNKVKEVARNLQGSQGFYGRLLRSMLESEEEFGGVENLPYPITM